jgi:hypothetical protein
MFKRTHDLMGKMIDLTRDRFEITESHEQVLKRSSSDIHGEGHDGQSS